MAYQNNQTQHLARRDSSSNPVATLNRYANSPAVKARFEQVLKDKAPQFISGILSAANINPALARCNPTSVMSSAMVAASLDLDVVPSLGFAALVPYKDNCQFQIMTRGLVQLALRSGQYLAINSGAIYADEYKGQNPITGEILWEQVPGGFRDKGDDTQIVGYFAYFKLLNGFEKTVYWSKEKVVQHALRFSQSCRKGLNGPWKEHFDAMAEKTVLKNALQHYGILNVKMQTAMTEDQKVFDESGDGTYADNPTAGQEEAMVEVAPAEVEEVQEAPVAPETAPQMPTPEGGEHMSEEEYQEMLREEDYYDENLGI